HRQPQSGDVDGGPQSPYYQHTEECLPLEITHESLDLLQQCRMAVATEKMNFWTRLATGISLLGFAAVVFTIIKNQRTHDANMNRLLAAEDAHKRAERALLSMESFSITQPETSTDGSLAVNVTFDVNNMGK